MPLLPERGFVPALDAVAHENVKLIYLNYPNNPTGAVVPDGFFAEVVEFARANEVLVVHDASYTETTFDGYVAPSFLETPGAKEVGVEVFSLSKGYNMTGWRTAAIVGNADAVAAYLKLKTNVDSGMFEAVQLAAAAALERGDDEPQADERDLRAPARPGLRGAGGDRRGRHAAEGHDLRLGAGARGPHLGVLLRAGAGGVRRGRLAGRCVRPERRGLLPHLADGAGRAAEPRPWSGCGPRWADEVLRRRSARGRAPAARGARGGARARAADPPRGAALPARLAGRRWPRPSRRSTRPWWPSAPRSASRATAARSASATSSCATRGVPPEAPSEAALALRSGLDVARGLRSGRGGGRARGRGRTRAPSTTAPLFETTADGVFAALKGHRLPARRHPWGVHLRIAELSDHHVEDTGGELWHRRIEELDALACALCAHRYAVGSRVVARGPGRGRDRAARQHPAGGLRHRGGASPGGANSALTSRPASASGRSRGPAARSRARGAPCRRSPSGSRRPRP